jgi:hypothetical protein
MILAGMPPLCRLAATHLPWAFASSRALGPPNLLPLETPMRASQRDLGWVAREFLKTIRGRHENRHATAGHCHPLPPLNVVETPPMLANEGKFRRSGLSATRRMMGGRVCKACKSRCIAARISVLSIKQGVARGVAASAISLPVTATLPPLSLCFCWLTTFAHSGRQSGERR